MTSREGEDTVVVPWAPGPVARAVPPSDVDAALDELFGPPDEGGPGLFDVALLVGGAVLAVRGALVAGVVVSALGLALPLRSAVRRTRRRARRRDLSARAEGSPLATGSPATAELLAAYDALLAVVGSRESEAGEEAVAAGHRAVVECASMLDGRTPATPEETAYVRRRSAAIRAAVSALRATPADRDERVAAVRAHEELEAVTGTSSLDDLRAVVRRASR